MARRCGVPNRPCHGMKGGLLGPFFQNGNDLSGYGLGSSGAVSSGRFTALYYTGLNMSQEFMGYYYINSPAYTADTSLYLYLNNI